MTDKIKNLVVILVFMLIILAGLFFHIIEKDYIFSIAERRKLAQFPEITVKNLTNGKWTEEFEKYTMDQFVQREEFRKIKTEIELNILKKQDVNNIYKYNDFLIEQIYPIKEKSIINITNKMNEIRIKYLNTNNNVYYTIVPDKNYYINQNNLRLDYQKVKNIMKENLSAMEYIDIFECLSLESYYYTDSHWKQECLLTVAEKIADGMNFNLQEHYEKEKISTFKGVYSGQFPIDTVQDEIIILENDILNNCEVYNYETKETVKIYNLNKINGFDKYDIYLSGATPLLEIKNPQSKTNNELIVFRDSYGSSLIPLLVEQYCKITVVDTRYISPKILGEYVNFENKDILFIYSIMVINNSVALK